jgi:HD-like signal output (HDOD) protein
MKAPHEFICDLAEKISMPEVYLNIRKLMENPYAQIGDYVNIVQTDSMLAIRIIRIANSEFFGFRRKVDDLYGAISLIGVIQLHDLLLSSLCMRTFYNIPEQILNFNGFWLHGIKCGIASRSIARQCRLPANNRFFTLGLLLEIGHAVMFVKAPELTLNALLESQQQGQPLDKIERKYFGFDYCQLGSALMRQWDLPEVYPHIIENHLYPEQSKTAFRNETNIVNLAYRFCETPGYLNQHATQKLSNHQQYAVIPENFEAMIAAEVADNADDVFTMLSPPNSYGMTLAGLGI